MALSAPAFAGRLWASQLAVLVATTAALWVFHRRRGRRGTAVYEPPAPIRLADTRARVLFRVAAGACVLFVAAIPVLGDAIGYAALIAAAVVVAAFAVLDRTELHLRLIPWQLLIFVTGLFLVVPTLSVHGLSTVMTALIGTDPGAAGAFRAATAGGELSNVVNNLPAYAAGEAVVPAGNGDRLLALLIGTNVGPIVTPWASLATPLCLEACRTYAVRVDMGRFVLHGVVLAVVAVGVGALLVTA